MKPLLALLALIALFAAPATAPAQNAPAIPPTTVLFVGNSFVHGAFEPVLSYGTTLVTDENAGLPADDPRSERRGGQTSGPWGGIAAIFETFTREAGLRYDVHIELVSGMPLRYHYDHALDVIAQPKWNVVVLQDLSTGPVLTTKLGSPADFERYTTLLEQAIHRANPAAKVLLYETFPRADLTYPAGSPYAGKSISVMGDALHDAYYGELHREGHIPASPRSATPGCAPSAKASPTEPVRARARQARPVERQQLPPEPVGRIPQRVRVLRDDRRRRPAHARPGRARCGRSRDRARPGADAPAHRLRDGERLAISKGGRPIRGGGHAATPTIASGP